MKKLLIIILLFSLPISCFSQTQPSYWQLKDLPIIDVKLDATVTTDNSSIMAAAEAQVPNGGILRLPAGRYKMKFHSFTTSNITISGQGPGATVLEVGFGGAGPAIGGFLGCDSSTTNVTFENFSIENPDDIPNLSPLAIGGNYCTVRNVHVTSFSSPYDPGESWYSNLGGGKGFHIDYSGKYNTIENCVASGTMWGFSMVTEHGAPYENKVQGNTIKNCKAINCDVGVALVAFGVPATGTPLTPYYTLALNSTITDNQIINCRVAFATHQIAAVNFTNNFIHNDFASAPIYSAPIGSESSDIFAMQICKSQLLTLVDNYVSGFYTKELTFADAFYTNNGWSEYNTVANNALIGSSSVGIALDGTQYSRANIFSKNKISATARFTGADGDYNYFEDYDPLSRVIIGGITGYGMLTATPAMDISEGHAAFETIKLNMFGNSRKIGQSTATPTVDAAAIGDIYFNTDPNAASHTGWICIHESGATYTHGLWKTFGNL